MSPQGFIRCGSTNLHARSGALSRILMHELHIRLRKGRRSIKAPKGCFGARSSRVRSRKALKSGCTSEAVLASATRSCLQLGGRCSPSPPLYPPLWKTRAGIAVVPRELPLAWESSRRDRISSPQGGARSPSSSHLSLGLLPSRGKSSECPRSPARVAGGVPAAC